jgi:hypothetical protein
MSRWDGSPALTRVKSFINYVTDLVSTDTLQYDTYPVTISKEWIRPGVIFLSPVLSPAERERTGFHGGHAEYIRQISDTGFSEFISSTTPAMVRTLSLNSNPYQAPLVTRGGLRLWKEPKQFSQNEKSLPGYGLDQFKLADWAPLKLITRRQIFQWHEEIRLILRTRIPSFEERVQIVVDSICTLLQTRADLVKQGWAKVTQNGGRCLSAEENDEFSTDTRDQRIRGAYLQLWDLYDWKKRNDGDAINGSVDDAQGALSKCVVPYWYDRSMTAWEIYPLSRDNKLESSAYYAPAVRWGFREKESRDCR